MSKVKKTDRDAFDYRLDSVPGITLTRWNDNRLVTLLIAMASNTEHCKKVITVQKIFENMAQP